MKKSAMALDVSVVIPYYNGSRFIAEALASVCAQTLKPREIIVVDDGSRPEEARILDLEGRAQGAVVIHLPRNRGVSVARNVGVARAQGEWIGFLDCDDLWDPRKLELQAAVVERDPSTQAVHCGMRNVAIDGSERIYRKGEVGFDDFLVFPCHVFPSATLMRRDTLLEIGLFDPTLRCCQDLDLFMRFCAGGERFRSAPDPLLVRRIQPDGVSRNNGVFWDEAERVYRSFAPLFEDQRSARRVLREIHVDMLVRAAYARDGQLVRRIVGRARRADAPLPILLGLVFARILQNWLPQRLGRAVTWSG